MQHKLNLEAAAAYGRLFKFVINVEQDKFAQAFEEFLDAYDGDSKPDKTQTVENFQREVNEQTVQYIKDYLEHVKFDFAEQLENSRLDEIYKRFVDNDNVKIFSVRRLDDGAMSICFEEVLEA